MVAGSIETEVQGEPETRIAADSGLADSAADSDAASVAAGRGASQVASQVASAAGKRLALPTAKTADEPKAVDTSCCGT